MWQIVNRKIRNYIVFIIFSFLYALPVIGYAQLQFNIDGNEESTYRTILEKSGKVIWQAERSVIKRVEDGKEIVVVSESGHGKYNNSPEDMHWIVKSRILSSQDPVVLETTRTAFSSNNKELWRKNKIFDYSKKRLIAEHFDNGRLIKRKSIPFPEGKVFISEILSLILRGYNFETQEPCSFYIFSWDGKVFKMKARRIDKEIVHVPAGKFECYKIEIFPDFGIVNYLSNHIFPKTYLWFTVKAPHYWVKYEGLESGLTSSYVTMEITEFNGKKE
ncbi:MAG: DUF3108 domain-containing protein [Candidatus Omnitrophica bacterium]|nr:DUF3108 domain-containing protein [Candidatus Omnitrophota bacterium]